jgi:hypothetical protein
VGYREYLFESRGPMGAARAAHLSVAEEHLQVYLLDESYQAPLAACGAVAISHSRERTRRRS